jgi:hypothetical protein
VTHENNDEAPSPCQRKIIHVDMDAFYASVEQRDNPDLRGKPVAVGGSRERGVVAAASYEARKFGVRSAMPSVTAKRQCPDLIFVKPRFEVYKAVSQQIREIFAEHTPIIEPLSLDEAYLDVTENLQRIPLARDVALAIRAKIKPEIRRCRKHFLQGSHSVRSHACGIAAADRQGLAALRGQGHAGPDRDAQGKVRRLRIDLAKPNGRRRDR